MPNSENLRPVRSKEEASELGRKGGIASGIARKERRLLSDCLHEELARECQDGNTNAVQIIKALIEEARSGDVRAMNLIFDRIEGKAVQPIRAEGLTPIAQKLVEARKRLREN